MDRSVWGELFPNMIPGTPTHGPEFLKALALIRCRACPNCGLINCRDWNGAANLGGQWQGAKVDVQTYDGRCRACNVPLEGDQPNG